jgi:MFS transporter, DHA2 family, multidrug resistance protein
MSPSSEHADGLPQPQRRWAILTIALGIVMAVLDGAIANVALPTIAEDLHASPSFSIWIVNGYQLAITISLLPLASLGEIISYRRVYLAGLLLFTLASALCALSHTLIMLTAARIIQGFGAAGIMSVNAALVRFTYPHAMLGRGIGINALVVAISAAVGPTVAAAILAVGSWPYLFAINIPVGIAALALGWHCLPHTKRASHIFDWQSAGLSAITFGFAIAAIDSLGHGEAPLFSLAELAVASVAGVLLVLRQTHMPSPLLPVDLLRIPVFALSISNRLVLRPDARLRRHSLLSAKPLWIFCCADGPADHAMADCRRVRGPGRRAAGRALSGRSSGRRRAELVRGWSRRIGIVARPPLAPRSGLAHGARGRRFRAIPDAQQSHDDRRCPP